MHLDQDNPEERIELFLNKLPNGAPIVPKICISPPLFPPPEALLFGPVFCYTVLMSSLHLYMHSWLTRTYVFLGLLVAARPAFAADIPLLESPETNGRGTVQACKGLGTFFLYFNSFWPWLIGSATGIAVLMTIVGGLQVIMSGGDQGKRSEGTTRFMHALIGLLMLACAGLILRTLNPSFFTSGAGSPCDNSFS